MINDYIDIIIARLAIWSIKRGWGANCETKDTDDFPSLILNSDKRCGSCQAKEVIQWFEDHISLIKGK